MTALRLRAALRGPRRRLALLLAVLLLGGATAYHHVEPSGMDGMVSGAICLAVIGGGTALLVARVLPRWRPTSRAVPLRRRRSIAGFVPARGVPARAGPLYLQLSVLRR